jgi:hypothetical protein
MATPLAPHMIPILNASIKVIALNTPTNKYLLDLPHVIMTNPVVFDRGATKARIDKI